LKQLTQKEQLKSLIIHTQKMQIIVSKEDLAHMHHLYCTYCNNARTIYRYIPQVYSGKILLLCASDKEANIQREEATAWQKWTTEQISLHSVPGDHYTMLKEPNVQVLATKLKDQIKLSRYNTSSGWPIPNVTNQSVGSEKQKSKRSL
jgi:thioesterase domain-containing protein